MGLKPSSPFRASVVEGESELAQKNRFAKVVKEPGNDLSRCFSLGFFLFFFFFSGIRLASRIEAVFAVPLLSSFCAYVVVDVLG